MKARMPVHARATFQRVVCDGGTSWNMLCAGAVVCRLTRADSLGRGYSKSQMSTRHVSVWRGSVAQVPGLSDIERRAVQRELDSRDKTTRETAALHALDSYAKASVPLPLGPAREAA
jgi:hypothetical protein